jgi:hypothetical protein
MERLREPLSEPLGHEERIARRLAGGEGTPHRRLGVER